MRCEEPSQVHKRGVTMPSPLLLVVGVMVSALVGALVAYLWVGNRNRERDLVSNAEREKLLSDAETQMKEMVLEAKEEAHRIRLSLEQEVTLDFKQKSRDDEPM